VMLAVAQLAPRVGLRSACQAFALNRGFVYRDRARRGVTASRCAPQVRPRPPFALERRAGPIAGTSRQRALCGRGAGHGLRHVAR
jgi:hypothetical protein